MNWVTTLWSVSLGATVTLGCMHVLVWLKTGRAGWAHLAFSFAAFAVAGIAVGEMLLMAAHAPADFARVQRWMHVPLAVMVTGMVCFVRLFFGTGRVWLGVSALAVRWASLGINFFVPVNLNYREISSLRTIEFLGESISIPDATVANPWNWVAVLSSLLVVLFVADASLELWKGGGVSNRRKALGVGGSIIGFVFMATVHAMLVHTGELQSPYLISFSFLAIIMAMAHELSHDVINAARLSGELAESQEQMGLAATAARLAIWTWDIPTNRIWVTAEGRAVYGVAEDEEITIEGFLATVHADDRVAVRQGLDAALASAGTFSQEYRIVLPDGQVRWITGLGKIEVKEGKGREPLRMRGVSLDTTQRHEAEERSLLMVEAAPYAMLMADASGRIVLVNRQVEVIFGYAREELLGQPLDILIPERLRAVHQGLVHGFFEAPTGRFMGQGREVCGRRRDGTEFPLEVGLNPIRSGRETLVLASILDISERRRTERELAQQRNELAHLSRVSSLGQLSGALAHELNQPLSIILSNAQAAQRRLETHPEDVGELKAILADIIDEDRRAGEVINRLRSLLKRGETRMGIVSLNDVVRDVLRLIHSDLLVRGVFIETALADGLPPVLGDPVQLQQVLLNLILNGCDAMDQVPVRDRRLRLATRHDGTVVRVSVRDHGCGLPEGDVEQVFQPFFTTKSQGLGIGLAITRSIVEAHHGRLCAEPNSGLGATFHLELPVSSPPSP